MHDHDVFISYSREDAGVARIYAEAFMQAGLRCWWDADLRSGETFDEVIEKALRAAKAVVVLWSPRSVTSRWVRAEATLADRNGTLAPVIIEPCERPIIFELTHTADLCHWDGDPEDPAWLAFLEDVRGFVEPEGQAGGSVAAHARHTAHKAAPPPANRPASDFIFMNGKVESLISALSSLRAQMAKSTKSEPAVSDDFEQTQFYTRADDVSKFGGDEIHCLELSNGNELEKRFVVSPLGLKIGRTAPSDVILSDFKVSRTHCKVELRDNELYVLDLNSTNGTFVDGERVAGPAAIPLGSAITIGSFTLVHELRLRSEL